MKKIVICIALSLIAYYGIMVPTNQAVNYEDNTWIVDYDMEKKIVYVELEESLINGSDGACQMAGVTILNILEEYGPGWKVYIVNDWVPSNKNPIDLKLAKVLAKGY